MRRWGKWAVLAWAGWRLFGPALPPRTAGAQERPQMPPGRTVAVGRHELLVREAGPKDGPPVVLIHGWVYGSTGTWHRVIPHLADRYRVVAIDYRNHGKADRVQGRYTIEQVADEVAGAMRVLGLRRATVVGYSMGGMIAQALARRHPALAARLVLAATGAFPIPVRRWFTRGGFGLARALGRVGSTLGARISYHYLLRVGAVEPRHAAWLWDTLIDRDINLYFAGGAAIWNFDSREWIGRVGVPAMVIIPTKDQLVPPAAQYELAALIPGVEVVELVGARHEAALTRAEDVAKAIARFAGTTTPTSGG